MHGLFHSCSLISDTMVPYALSSTSSLPPFSMVMFLRAASSISLGSKEATTTGYQGPVVTVFLNRAFLLFSAPDTENYGDHTFYAHNNIYIHYTM